MNHKRRNPKFIEAMIEELLRRCQFYRRHVGGFWVYSNISGWQQPQEWIIPMDIDCCKSHPELYNGGKDIEDYRSKK